MNFIVLPYSRAMSSKRKSPPTKLEGGCQPTQTTSVPLVSSDSTVNKFRRSSDDTIRIEKDYSRVDVANDILNNGLLQSIDAGVNSDDDEYRPAEDNDNVDNNVQQNCNYNGESMVNINGSEHKSIDDSESDTNSNECVPTTTPLKDEIDFEAYTVDSSDNNKTTDAACDDDIVKNTNRPNFVNNNIYNKHTNNDKKHCSQLIDEHNNNSDYDEPCKRMKIDRSPIYSVRCAYKRIYHILTLKFSRPARRSII